MYVLLATWINQRTISKSRDANDISEGLTKSSSRLTTIVIRAHHKLIQGEYVMSKEILSMPICTTMYFYQPRFEGTILKKKLYMDFVKDQGHDTLVFIWQDDLVKHKGHGFIRRAKGERSLCYTIQAQERESDRSMIWSFRKLICVCS